MNVADQKLLLNYSRLMLSIARAKAEKAYLASPPPETLTGAQTKAVVITDETVRKSAGYVKLRAFHSSLSPRKKEKHRAMLKAQMQGVRDVLRKAKESGEDLTLADIEFEFFDLASGEVIPDRPNVQLEAVDEPAPTPSGGSPRSDGVS